MADENPSELNNLIDQADIDRLTAPNAGKVDATPADPTQSMAEDVQAAMAASMDAAEKLSGETPDAIDDAMRSSAASDAHLIGGKPSPTPLSEAASFEQPALHDPGSTKPFSGIELIDDVELDMKVELGRTTMYLDDVLRLGVGSVIELDKLAGDPVDIYVNDRLVARGEVLVLNDNFCVRINGIQSPVPELDGSR